MAKGSDRVKAQSVDSRIQPEAHLVEHRGGNFRVLPVQIRLASQEMMQIVLLTSRFPLPGRSAERGYPVIWLSAVRVRIAPDIPISLWISPAIAALAEPIMLIRSVSKYHIDNHFQTSLMRRSQ